MSELQNTNRSMHDMRGGANSFNALRFFFCLVVIVGHCLDISHTEFIYRNWIDMHISVCAFFILSGYWITKSYLKDKNVKLFYRKRAGRILPFYYITVFGFACFLVFFSTFSARDYFTSAGFWKYLFWNTLTLNFMCPMLPGVFNGNPVNGALWTIKVEIGFYLILPLLVLILDKLRTKKRKNAFLIIIYVLSILWNVLLAQFAEKLGLPKQLSYQLPGFMSFFVSGMLYVYNEEQLVQKEHFMIVPAVLLFILHYMTKTEFLLPFSLTVLIMFLGKRLSFLSPIGSPVDYSYGMYLLHFPLINIFTYLDFFEKAPIFLILIIIAAVLGMAFVVEKYIQKKINRLIK